jgi:hypothetical protein
VGVAVMATLFTASKLSSYLQAQQKFAWVNNVLQ